VKKRLGDRRSRPRFDVVGNLTGHIEVWQPSTLRNLGTGGALVECTLPLSPAVRVAGRLSAGREAWRVRADVIHARTDEAGGHLFGLQWLEAVEAVSELIATLAIDTDTTFREEPDPLDRRRSRRLVAPPDVELELGVILTATVIDISASGLLISARAPIEPGAAAELGMRFGDDDFVGRVEVRRTFASEQGDWRMGAQFVGLDDSSRRSLEALLSPKH
jgi:hypothetical protein